MTAKVNPTKPTARAHEQRCELCASWYLVPHGTLTNGYCPSCNTPPETTSGPEADKIHHPGHYTWHPIAECHEIAQEFGYNIGTAIAYLWRHPYKNGIEDLEKAQKHIDFEIDRLRIEADRARERDD